MPQGGEDWRCHSVRSQLSIVRGDQGVPDCTVQQWVVVGKTNSRVSYYQTDCMGGQATRDVGKMVARGVTLDIQLLVTRRR